MSTTSANRVHVTGWVVAASVLLIVVGGINVINGYTALEHSSYYGSRLVYNNLTFWGWVFIIYGGAQIVAGVLAWTGRAIGNLIGIVLAAAASMLWFFMVWSEPWAALVGVGLNLAVLIALTAGAERDFD